MVQLTDLHLSLLFDEHWSTVVMGMNPINGARFALAHASWLGRGGGALSLRRVAGRYSIRHHNRYVDRFVIRDGLVVETDVWNDGVEWLPVGHAVIVAEVQRWMGYALACRHRRCR